MSCGLYNLNIWNPVTGSLVQSNDVSTDWVFSLAVLQNGNLVSGSNDKLIKIWG